VTTPEANPPAAPAKALKAESDFPTQNDSNPVRGTCCLVNAACDFAYWAEADVVGAYPSVLVGDGVLRSCDIVINWREGEPDRLNLNREQRFS
jgi:hypothetical protein